jgi:uncharacterized protein YjaZ
MLEVQNAALFIPGFIPAIQKLSKARGIPAKTAYRLGKITKVILREFSKTETKRIAILRAHAEKNEAGEWVKNDKGEIQFKDQAAMKAELEALLGKSFTIEQLPVPLEHLDAADLAPNEIAELDFMLVRE